jgi:endoglucanase
MDRLAATKDAASGLYGKTANYYDQNLALFANGWIEGRYRFDRDGKLRVKWK